MSTYISSILRAAYEKTSYLIDEKCLKKNDFTTHYIESIIGLLSNSYKERGIFLHHGSKIPLYFATVLASYKAYLSDDSDKTTFLDDLNKGDLVLYENKRGVYEGRAPNGNIIIVNKDRGGISTTNYVPITSLHKVQPYFGEGRVLDGRGIKKKRNVFGAISELFGIKNQDVKSVVNKWVLIVCDRLEADEIGKMSFIINKKSVKLCELFPAAYFTANEVYHYPGNAAKVEPVIRFVNKLSLAREMIIENKEIETLIISGMEYFLNSISELASIYERGSLRSIILLGELCKGVGSASHPIYELDNLKTFVWTKDILSNYGDVYTQDEHIHNEGKKMQLKISNYINFEKEIIQINSSSSNEDFLECKKNLLQLSKKHGENELVINIIKKAYWLINLLERSFFPISVMEEMIFKGQINAPSPSAELVFIEQGLSRDLGIENQLKTILRKIKNKLSEMNYKNQKFEYLIEKITNSGFSDRKISIICTKTYYHKIFIEAAPSYLKNIIERIDFFTPNKYDSSKLYHNVYILGVWDWSWLNPLLLSNTKLVSFVLYENELNRFHHAEEVTQKRLLELNKNNLLLRNNSVDPIISYRLPANAVFEPEENYIEDHLEKLTESLSLSFFIEEYATSSYTVGQTSEIVKVALLETGEMVLFTKFYSAYIYNIDKKIVQETDVTSLNEGDLIIFTNYDSDTRDIVERIMNTIIESDNCSEHFKEAYRKSRRWKELLRDYISIRQIGYKDLSEMMAKLGMDKHEVTLRTWLDDESHIVGPRDITSYKIIAEILQDSEMLIDPESFFQSSREVRSMRIRILKYLGKNIIKTYNKEEVYDEILSLLPIDLTKLSRLVQIDKIINTVNLEIPSHLANRPIQT